MASGGHACSARVTSAIGNTRICPTLRRQRVTVFRDDGTGGAELLPCISAAVRRRCIASDMPRNLAKYREHSLQRHRRAATATWRTAAAAGELVQPSADGLLPGVAPQALDSEYEHGVDGTPGFAELGVDALLAVRGDEAAGRAHEHRRLAPGSQRHLTPMLHL